MKFRHEWKHEISWSDVYALRARLQAVLQPDPYATNGRYCIRSLYLDNVDDKALREKLDGVNIREKFRVRYYNANLSRIVLEKKSRINGLCRKDQAVISLEEARAISLGRYEALLDSTQPLVQELAMKMKNEGLRPRTIVDYTREPFVYAPGNVRVTLDYNIRTGLTCTDFLNPDCITIPAKDAPVILEVKWDAFLPTIVRDLVQCPGTRTGSFSKYAACRIYG